VVRTCGGEGANVADGAGRLTIESFMCSWRSRRLAIDVRATKYRRRLDAELLVPVLRTAVMSNHGRVRFKEGRGSHFAQDWLSANRKQRALETEKSGIPSGTG